MFEFLEQESTLQSTLRCLSEKNSRDSYETQYFLIGEALKKKAKDGSTLCTPSLTQPNSGAISRRP